MEGADNWAGLDEVMGDGSKMIQQLLKDKELFSKTLNDLKNTGSNFDVFVDPFNRLSSSWTNLSIIGGDIVLPTIITMVDAITDATNIVSGWADEYPILAEYVGYASIGLMSFVAAAGAWSIASGIATLATGVFAGALTLLTWPVLAVIAVLGAVTAAVYYFWDPIKVFLGGFLSGMYEASGVAEWFDPLINIFTVIGNLFSWLGSLIGDFLPSMDATEGVLNSVANAGHFFGRVIGSFFRGLMLPIEAVLKGIDWLIAKLNLIPGIDIDIGANIADLPQDAVLNAGVVAANGSVAVAPEALNASVDNANFSDLPPEAFSIANTAAAPEKLKTEPLLDYKQPQNIANPSPAIKNAIQSTSSTKTVQYGDIYINQQEAFTRSQLEEWKELDTA